MSMCNICCEKYNKTLNTKVTCYISNCGFEACKTCIRKYLLATTSDPHCMNCKNPWTNKFLVDNLNRSYINNEYKKHRKELLVEREISRTPELMNLAERTKIIDDKNIEFNELSEQLKNLRNAYNELYKKVYDKRYELLRLKNGQDLEIERKKFIMPCPGENCKGFLSSQYKCELCKQFTCPDCFEIIGSSHNLPHECSPDNLKTAEMIKRETKGCPNCGVRIYKIEGCDQMWCIECHVAFSWNTGKIVLSGNIHNPHYYEYINGKNNGNGNLGVYRNPQDVLCGGLIGYNRFIYIYKIFAYLNTVDVKNDKPIWYKYLFDNCLPFKILCNRHSINDLKLFTNLLSALHRLVSHITNVDLINYRTKVRDLLNNDTNTIAYILNKKSRNELADIVFKNDNMRKKYVELLNIYELISVVGVERFNEIMEIYNTNHKYYKFSSNSYDNVCDASFIPLNARNKCSNIIFIVNYISKFINEYDELINYANNQLMLISYTYNHSVSIIDNTNNSNYYKLITQKFSSTDIQNLTNNASCSYH